MQWALWRDRDELKGMAGLIGPDGAVERRMEEGKDARARQTGTGHPARSGAGKARRMKPAAVNRWGAARGPGIRAGFEGKP